MGLESVQVDVSVISLVIVYFGYVYIIKNKWIAYAVRNNCSHFLPSIPVYFLCKVYLVLDTVCIGNPASQPVVALVSIYPHGQAFGLVRQDQSFFSKFNKGY